MINNPITIGALQRRMHQQGLATLTVVMVLFFIMAMVAAYTNRNLIFEQRTSANSFHSAQALAAADAGVDWAVAVLNSGAMDTDCVGAAAGSDFRSRYLSLTDTGTFQPKKLGAAQVSPTPSCVMKDSGWNCNCPNGADVDLPVVSGDAPVVFRVKLKEVPEGSASAYPGVIPLEVQGCTSAISGEVSAATFNSASACHKSGTVPEVDGRAGIQVALGLVSALPVPPVAPLTMAGDIIQTAGTLRASNPDPSTGATLHAGATISSSNIQSIGAPGSVTSLQLDHDSQMATLATTPNDFFQAFFGMAPADYKQQPGAVQAACGGTCNSAALTPIQSANPTRIILVNGDFNFDQAMTWGTATQPVILIVSGNVTFSANTKFYGAIYSTGNINWDVGAAGGAVIGALVGLGNYSGASDATFVYDSEVLRRLRQSYGSFVRVPGSWTIRTS